MRCGCASTCRSHLWPYPWAGRRFPRRPGLPCRNPQGCHRPRRHPHRRHPHRRHPHRRHPSPPHPSVLHRATPQRWLHRRRRRFLHRRRHFLHRRLHSTSLQRPRPRPRPRPRVCRCRHPPHGRSPLAPSKPSVTCSPSLVGRHLLLPRRPHHPQRPTCRLRRSHRRCCLGRRQRRHGLCRSHPTLQASGWAKGLRMVFGAAHRRRRVLSIYSLGGRTHQAVASRATATRQPRQHQRQS